MTLVGWARSVLNVNTWNPWFTPVPSLLFLNVYSQFTLPLNLRSLIFGLTNFGQPLISDGNTILICVLFLLTPTFSGEQVGRKTRAGCIQFHYSSVHFEEGHEGERCYSRYNIHKHDSPFIKCSDDAHVCHVAGLLSIHRKVTETLHMEVVPD